MENIEECEYKILISIQPKWCELIASGKKTIEVWKTRPKIETPSKVYIYCTTDKRLLRKFDKGERIDDEHFFDEHVFVRQNTWIRGHLNPNKKVIGEFVCDNIFPIRVFENGSIQDYMFNRIERSCVTYEDIANYIGNYKTGYGWHISDLKIYDKPKELSEFSKYGFGKPVPLKRPPQSWMYVEENR